MNITLTHDQVQRLRNYIDVAESVRQSFNFAGKVAKVHATIDDTHVMLTIIVSASPPDAVAVLTAAQMNYQTMDYHTSPAITAATYRVECFGHEVMVVAQELHNPATAQTSEATPCAA